MGIVRTSWEENELQWIEEMKVYVRSLNLPDLAATGIEGYLEEQAALRRSEVDSRLTTLVAHLLKLNYQPEKQIDSNSWQMTCNRERTELEILIGNPNLKKYLNDLLRSNSFYRRSHRIAEKETGKSLPRENPFSPEQIMDFDFYTLEK